MRPKEDGEVQPAMAGTGGQEKRKKRTLSTKTKH